MLEVQTTTSAEIMASSKRARIASTSLRRKLQHERVRKMRRRPLPVPRSPKPLRHVEGRPQRQPPSRRLLTCIMGPYQSRFSCSRSVPTAACQAVAHKLGPRRSASPTWRTLSPSPCRAMLRVAVLGSLCAYGTAIAVTWASTPVFPSEALVVHGYFTESPSDCTANLSTTSAGVKPFTVVVPVASGQASSWSLKFVLPSDLPIDAYALVVSCPGSTPTPVVSVNAAEAWWFQGRAAERAEVKLYA